MIAEGVQQLLCLGWYVLFLAVDRVQIAHDRL